MSLGWALLSALWFGLLATVSPCPLATNIATISFLSRDVSSPRRTLLAAMCYVLGKVTTYVLLAGFALWAFDAFATGLSLREFTSSSARGLQRYGTLALGPALLLIGMILLDLLHVEFSIKPNAEAWQRRAKSGRLIWTFLLGMVFALVMCPPAVALFLATLMVSIESDSRFLPAAAYGVGSALPVVVFAFLIAFAAHRVAGAFHAIARVERWVRTFTGVLFVAVGVWYTIRYIWLG
jgi:cytochrome c-type biogenesis protein